MQESSYTDRQIVERCRDFESSWEKQSSRPRIEDYLAGKPAEGDPLFEALLSSEIELRLLDGEHPVERLYLERFPSAGGSIRQVFAELDELAPVSVPDSLGDFQMIRRLGRGASSVVYEAVQRSLDRRVALKVLVMAHLDARARSRVQREATAVARVQHPNIVTLHGIGSEQGYSYLVMQYVSGCGLDRLLTGSCEGVEQPLEEFIQSVLERSSKDRNERVARLGLEIATALAYAHRNGVLHRDVKPSNIILNQAGEALLADFGLAKLAEPGAAWSRSMAVVGTPNYISPEAFEGRWDERCDVYSLGVTLHEVLTGYRPPRQDSSWRIRRRSSIEERPAARSLIPEIDVDLETIVMKAVALEPEERYQTAAECADDLQRYLAHEPIGARRPSRVYRLLLWCRRDPLLAAMSLAMIVVLVTATIVSAFQADRASGANVELRRNVRDAYLERWEQSVRDGEHGAGLLWMDRAAGILAQGRRPSADAQLRDRTRFVSTLERMPRLDQVWFGRSGRQAPIRFVPHSDYLLTGNERGGLQLIDYVARRVVVPDINLPEPITQYELSGNGRWLVASGLYERAKTVGLFELPGGTLRVTKEFDVAPVRDVAISPDGGRFAVLCKDLATVYDVASGGAQVAEVIGWFDPIVFSNDGQVLRQCAVTLPLVGGAVREGDMALRDVVGQVYVWASSANGRWTALAEAGLLIYNNDTGEWNRDPIRHPRWDWFERPTPNSNQTEGDEIRVLRWSPVEDQVAVGTAGGSLILVDAAARSPIGVPYYHRGPIRDAAFSPCGLYVATASEDATVVVFSAPDLKPVIPVLRHESAVAGLAYSEDGSRLATVTHDGITRVWDLRRALHRGWDAEPGVNALAWDPGHQNFVLSRENGALEIQEGDGEGKKHVIEAGGEVRILDVSEDAEVVAVLNHDLRVRVAKQAGGTPIHFRPGILPFDITVSPDGQWLSAGHSINLDLTEIATRRRRLFSHEFRWNGQRHPSRKGVVFTRDSEHALVFDLDESFRSVHLASDWTSVMEMEGAGSVSSAVEHPNGRSIAVAFDTLGVFTLRMPGLERLGERLPVTRVIAMEYRPDGQVLAIASADGTIRCVDSDRPEQVLRMQHGEGIDGIHFIPSNPDETGREWLLVSWGRTGVLKVWDPVEGTAMLAPWMRPGALTHVVRGNRKGTVWTLSEDRIMSEWRLPSSRTETALETKRWAQLYAAHKLNEEDRRIGLSLSGFQSLWRELGAVNEGQSMSVESKKREISWRWYETWHAFAKERYEAALFHLDYLLADLGSQPTALLLRGDILVRLHQWAQAEQSYRDVKGHNVLARIGVIKCRLAQGLAASSDWNWLISSEQVDPFHRFILVQLHSLLVEEQPVDQSLLESAVAQSGVFALQTIEYLRDRQVRAESRDWAIWGALGELMDVAMDQRPARARLQFLRGLVLGNLGDWAESKAAFHDVVSSGILDETVVHRCLARAFYETDDADGFIEAKTTKSELQESTEYWHLRGDTMMNRGYWLEAYLAYHEAKKRGFTSEFLESTLEFLEGRISKEYHVN